MFNVSNVSQSCLTYRANMSGRHRALPSWMSKKEETVKQKQPLKTRRKRKTARAAFYCMNEQELVEMAVSCLTSAACEDVALPTDQKIRDKTADTAVKIKGNPVTSKTAVKPVTEALQEESSDCSDARETKYVSETDFDITELETVPYTKNEQLQDPGSEGQRSGPDRDHAAVTNAGLEAEKKQEPSQMPPDAAEEDDAFRLVREIFFT